MTTRATEVWINYMNASCSLPDYPSAVLSGIVGDPEHAASGGYHISIEDQVSQTNFSVVLPKDKAPPGNWPRNLASAGDKSMSTADMIKEWNRYLAVFQNSNDPRRKYIRAYNGWNGVGEAERLDFAKGTRTITTRSHRWHSHREGYRCFANDPEMARAFLSIERGESATLYSGDVAPAATSSGGKEKMHAVVQVLGMNDVWEVKEVDGERSCVPVGDPNKVKRLIRLGANKSFCTGFYGGDGPFSSIDEMVETCGPIVDDA